MVPARLSGFGILLGLLVIAAGLGCASERSNEVAESRADRLRQVRFFCYQIQKQHFDDNIEKIVQSDYDLVIVDQIRSILGDEDYDSQGEVRRIKESRGRTGRGKIVLAYIDVGEAESYRWYWKDTWEVGNPDWIVAEDPDGWDENYPVKFWVGEWKRLMKSYVKRIMDDGYDGIYLDWLEAYSFAPVAEAAEQAGLDPALELREFVRELATFARSREPEFILVAQNAPEMGEDAEYVALFDAIAQEAIWYDGGGDPDDETEPGDHEVDTDLTQEYVNHLEDWQALGKPVFNIEYAEEPENAVEAYRLGEEHGFVSYVTLRPLAALTQTPPPGL
ncbi:MAG: endo alpha-1,4 polygalactosaminidase [Terriglobia bacterium]